MRVRQFLVMGAVALLAACAGAGSTTGTSASPSRGSDRDVITAEDIVKASGQTAYDVVKELRPAFFQTRGAAQGVPGSVSGGGASAGGGGTAVGNGSISNTFSPVDVAVFVDGTRRGNAENLREITANQIAEIRHYSASQATTRWGTGFPAGAIEVILKK